MRGLLGATLVLASILSGCTGGGGGADSAVDVTQASCVQVASTTGSGYAGEYVETSWNISAAGTASGPVGTKLSLVARAHGHSREPWSGDATLAASSWGSFQRTWAQRAASEQEQTAWTAEGWTTTHTDYVDLHDDDVAAAEFEVEAAAGDPGVSDLVRDAMTVTCS